jgi:hypothetical protein
MNDVEATAAHLILNKNMEVIRELLTRIDNASADESVNLSLAITMAVSDAFKLGAVAGIRESQAAVVELAKAGMIGAPRDNPKPEMN